MATTLIEISDNLFVRKYLIKGGKMDGRIVQICYGSFRQLESVKNKYRNYKDFHKDIVLSNGILNYRGHPVTRDVLNAYNEFLPDELKVLTGRWTKGEGWVVSKPIFIKG